MNLLPFSNDDGSPRPDAAYVNMVLICALYFQERKPFDLYAGHVGGTVAYFDDNVTSYPPQVGVIASGRDALVVLAGSTVAMQIVGHVGGTLVPIPDIQVPCAVGVAQVNASFHLGAELQKSPIFTALQNAGLGNVGLTGHSYGGSCAHIISRWLANSTSRPQRNQLMTFGQPRTYDARPAIVEPDYYARVIYTAEPDTYQYENFVVDPVCTSPPAIIQLAKIGIVAKFLQKFLGFFWDHHGEPWLLNPLFYNRPQPTPGPIELLPFVNLLQSFGNSIYLPVHYQWNYLRRARQAWIQSGLSPDLSILEPYATKYLASVILPPQNLSPSLSAATINAGYFDPQTQPVTDPTRSEWEVVSATGYFVSAPSTTRPGSISVMSLFKGTMAFNSNQGGWSESVYSIDPTMTAQTMLQKMDGAMGKRCKLSITKSNTGCNNPIEPVFIRVEDTLVQRDAFTITESSVRQGFATGSDPADTNNQNLDLQLGARIKYVGGSSRQIAYVVHHGLPIFAYSGINPSRPEQYGSAFRRYPQPNASWMQQLANYVGYLGQQGLGFRTITGAWNDAATGAPLAYASPNQWFYNTAEQMVELQWTTAGAGVLPPNFPAPLDSQKPANWPNVNSVCRLQVRKWKSFALLAGRWAAKVVTPQTGFAFALRILRRCRNPNIPTDVVPVVSPVAWSVWFAGQNTTPGILTPSGAISAPGSALAAQWVFVEDKNLGKLFAVERGRQRNRPT